MNIRHAVMEDAPELARIEAASYPESEAASLESIKGRLTYFPECFWILEDYESTVAFINGIASDEADLADEMYHHPEEHKKDGKWQMIFSVVTDPTQRHKGYAGTVMRQVISDTKAAGRAGLVLTCKDHLVGFYAGFGFADEGMSDSTHGGCRWHKMRLKL